MIDKLIKPVSQILDKFVADKDLKLKLQHELSQELHKANLAQIEVNKTEAQHRSVFVAGWRPFTGWVCASALAYHFIVEPVIIFALSFFEIQLILPTFDMGSLLTVLMGMLGLGGLRTFEKSKGITK
ncbi:Protein of unknown function (DUF3154) [uncultured Mediterranean phage uvMED]|nr:Protein of unknown function (DUF3154) [uncultured Mediterranean phage uvMED]